MGKQQTRHTGKGEPVRERLCIVTRQRGDDADLIRFVIDPEGSVVPDVKAVLPGRGAWVTAERSVLQQAIQRKAFARAFKSATQLGGLDDLADRTEQVLRQQARGALGFARKAGLLVTGFAKVESALKSGQAAALVQASDSGVDGARKLSRLAGHFDVPVLRPLTHDEMGLSLGREHVIHAALLDGPGVQRFLAPLRRLEAFCHDGIRDDERDATQKVDPEGPVLGDKTAV
ncbi:MAG: RNA-binding protein [Pseudomonadota bacterium]